MKFVGVKQAASILGYSNVQSIYNLVYSGKLAFYRMEGRRQLLFDPYELMERTQPKKVEALNDRADAILNRNELRRHPT